MPQHRPRTSDSITSSNFVFELSSLFAVEEDTATGMLITMFHSSIALLALLAGSSRASLDLSFGNDADLTSFVTRPEIKTPKFHVNVHDASRLASGYWFLAPYAMIFQEKHASRYYQPCQTGPSIYDGSGELVWSGACAVKNQNTCDFRAWQFSNDTIYTSAILTPFRDVHDPQGHGIIMDDSYNTIGKVQVPTTEHNFNMHELNLVDDGNRALHIAHKPLEVDLSMYQEGLTSGWILDVGFREIDLNTGESLFEWWAAGEGHVNISESKVPFHAGMAPQNPWNWFHGNSVDKNSDGDYMLSSRFTDTLFKISGKDGSILWRLGGSKSSFKQDFQFARQHDARWLSTDAEAQTDTISFLDNSADDHYQIRNTSVARVVELDFSTSPWTARAIKEIKRPDHGLTRMRGNHQTLKNGNSFVCWSENAVLSEHSPEGDLLMDARFASHRFVTYRAYKFNFTSVPTEPIAVSAVAYGSTTKTSTTVFHVSWNGATEVTSWRFTDGDGGVIGEREKTGFETTFHAGGYIPEVTIEAIARNGSTIGRSSKTTVRKPEFWQDKHSSHEKNTPQAPHPMQRPTLFSSEGLAFCLFASTVIMLGVALWLWRCTNGGRSSIRLSTEGSHMSSADDKIVDLS